MPTRETSRLEMHVQSTDMRQLYIDLKGVEGNLRVALRRRIVAASKPVVDHVKTSTSWSTRIPGAVKAKPSFSAKSSGVAITVDAAKAPEAAPLENKGKAGQFRHKVFGRDVWVNQEARPFWNASIAASTPSVEREISKVLDDVARQAGFK